MGQDLGGYSYIDQQRNINLRVTKGELAKGLAAGVIDPEEAARALEEREEKVREESRRNRCNR